MKISAVIAAGCLSLALSGTTPTVAAQQSQPAQRPSSGGSQVGSGSGVNTDPATQGTTDRAGQTHQPAGTSGTMREPTGSVLTDKPSTGDSNGKAGAPQGGSGTDVNTSKDGDQKDKASDGKNTSDRNRSKDQPKKRHTK